MGRGVVLLHHSRFIVQDLSKSYGPYSTFECLAVFIKSATPVKVFIVYRPPSSSQKNVAVSINEEFECLLARLATKPESLLIVGDFNLHLDKPDAKAPHFMDILTCYNLVQHIVSPTHIKGHILDLIITRAEEDIVCD